MENDFFKKRENELVEDTIVLGKAVKSFWEVLPIPVCTTSPVFIILETGKWFDALFGYEKNELAGESLKELAFKKDDFEEIIGRLSGERKISNVEAILRNKDGEKVSVLVSAIAQEDDHGEVFSYLFSFIDVTLIKKTERELQEKIKDSVRNARELTDSKQALMNILEDIEQERKKAETERDKTLAIIKNFADGLLMIEGGVITLFNPKAAEFFKISENEAIGRDAQAFEKHEMFSSLFKLIKQKDKDLFREEFRMANDLILEVSGVYIGKGEACEARMIILHDITREKMVERMKTEFVSIAAHQLRTPLSAIKWILSMLLGGDVGEVPPEQRDLLEKSYQSNERMIRLVNDLLNTTRIEEGKFLAKITSQDIKELVRSTVAPFKEEVKRKGLDFSFQLPSGRLPKVGIDVEKIRLTIQNLMDNALHYTKQGTIKVALSFDKNENNFLFSITDTGIGISKDEQPRVFGKFFRAVSAIKTETEGSGLGLFIAKNIIEAHGGKIWFESKEGIGSTFYFTLPVIARS
ncbi:MAG: ATP-binding protein [Candidatus Pacebacteria bacterium]|nr:ATP-binding protein [Candidatus Paceibacterota bacterium]